MKTIDKSPRSISVEDFGSRMRSIGRGVTFDGSLDPQSLAHTAQFYYGIDSLHTLTLDAPSANQLATSFGTLAGVAKETLAKNKRRYNTYEKTQMHEFIGDLLVEKATLDLRVGNRDLGEIAATVDDALDIYHESPVMKKRSVKGKEGMYNHHNLGALLGTLSARAMETHIDARRSRTQQSRILARSALHGIYADAVGHMDALSGMQQGKTIDEASNARGRFMEMTAFAHNVLDWADVSAPEGRYVRFAVNREDCPRSQVIPRRGFDLLRYETASDRHVPVQVKIGSAGVYHEAIRIWRPTRPQDVMADTDAIVANFATLTDATADPLDLRNARTFVATQFEEKPSVQTGN